MKMIKLEPKAKHKQCRPNIMDVGQTVVRENVKDSTIQALIYQMRNKMKDGWEFSVGYGTGDEIGKFVIRRDK
jgi:hypothetical protein